MKINILGVSLVEILVSLLLISIILGAFEGLIIFSFQQTMKAYFFNQANLQINNVIERLSANQGRNIEQIIKVWNQQNKKVLPAGIGEVNGNFPIYTINIFWGKTLKKCPDIMLEKADCLSLKVQLA